MTTATAIIVCVTAGINALIAALTVHHAITHARADRRRLEHEERVSASLAKITAQTNGKHVGE